LPVSGVTQEAYAVGVQSDGKLIVAGVRGTGTAADVVLGRVNTNGTLDTTFGNGGWTTLNLGAADWANSLLILPDDQILIAGQGTLSGAGQKSDLLVARFTANGILDATDAPTGAPGFGPADGQGIRPGYIRIDGAGGNDVGHSLLIDRQGRIVVAGSPRHRPAPRALTPSPNR
jgi:uncharacterized delta-60 repeat protein